MKLFVFTGSYTIFLTGIRQICRLVSVTLFSATLAVQASPQSQQNSHSVKEIRQAAKKFLEEMQSSADNPNIEIEVGKIDPRLRLAQCDGQIQAFLPDSARATGKTTVGVRCFGTVAWKIFLSASVQVFQTVWVADRNLTSKQVISASDVRQQKVAVGYSRKQPIEDLAQILNTSPKRTLRSGSVFYQDSVCLVCRGDKVSVSAENQFITITMEGIALSDASLGQTAQIRNAKSKRVFGAIVTGKNRLSVNLSGTH